MASCSPPLYAGARDVTLKTLGLSSGNPISSGCCVPEKTAIAPVFDLLGKLLGRTGKQKPLALALQPLPKVQTCLAMAVLSLQVAMLANRIWGLPFRSISTIQGAFA